MKGIWKKLRGLFGVGAVWGVAWAGVGAAIGAVVAIASPGVWSWTNPIITWALGMGMYGFISGAGFGKILAFVEGKRTLRELSLGRVALWGLLGSAVVPPIFGFLGFFATGTTLGEIVGAMVVTGILGGVSAPGMVALARRPQLGAGDNPSVLLSEPDDMS